MSDEEVSKFLKSRLKNIDESTIKKLKSILNQNGCWERVVFSIPRSFSNKISGAMINEKARLHNETPADVLFNELKKRNTRVMDVIPWLESAFLDQALMLLKPDESLDIIQQPPKACHILNELNLTCQAKGFPTPKYQWYKDDIELVEQTFSDLNIKGITTVHEGVYCCKVYNIDRLTNKEKQQHVLSSKTLVTVGCVPKKAKPECLEIKRHPVSPATKVKQGSSIVLTCLAICGSTNVKYQWYQNGEKIPGEIKSSLTLDNLYPTDGKSQWYYTCEASTEHSSKMSKEAKINLDKANDDTQYYAKRKLALLIGNEVYLSLRKLDLPAADVVTLSLLLEDKGFNVFPFLNLTLTEMQNAVEMFTQFVEQGDYVVFYYAGHGFEEVKHYMIPIDAGGGYLSTDSLTVEFVLEKIQSKNPALAFMLVDMCRDQLDRIAVVTVSPTDSIRTNEASNTLIAYATSPRTKALEYPTHKNGIFMEHLIKYLGHRKFIVDILFEVKRDMDSLKQSPWTAGNLSKRLTLDDPCQYSSIRPKLDTLLSDFDNHYMLPPLNFDGYNVRIHVQKHKEVFLNAIDVVMEVNSNEQNKQPSLMVTLKDQGKIVPANLGVKLVDEECPQMGMMYSIINIQRVQSEISLAVLLMDAECRVRHINLKKPLVVEKFF